MSNIEERIKELEKTGEDGWVDEDYFKPLKVLKQFLED